MNAFGNNGRISSRVHIVVDIDAMPKGINIDFKCESLPFVELIAEMNDVIPTIPREYVIASDGGIPSTYTNTGMINMDPPAPNNPIIIPIKEAAIMAMDASTIQPS